jgi:hypothetical protein
MVDWGSTRPQARHRVQVSDKIGDSPKYLYVALFYIDVSLIANA